jgi:putative ABC transport system permease protein
MDDMRWYSLLLRLYPASFRNEYGGEMRAIFARRRRDARGLGVPSLWLDAAAEVAGNAPLVHADILRQDLRYSARVLRRSPGFAVIATLIVALGIGATTAAFSVTDFVLIRPLPFPEPDRLVAVWAATPGLPRLALSPANYRDWKAAATASFESMGTYERFSITMTGVGDAQVLSSATVSGDLFATLAVAPAIGRTFRPDDDREGAQGTVILSHRFWQSDFGGDSGVIGRTVTLDGAPYVVIGVMPRGFHFPSSDVLCWTTHRFSARRYEDSQRTAVSLRVIGRLRRGVTTEQATSELDAVAAQLERQFPRENKDMRSGVYLLAGEINQNARLMLQALSGAAACVLLIACANLANLLLARALNRRRELAVRAALGAGRERLVRQLITESLILACAGGAIGVGIAWASVPMLARLVPANMPIAAVPSIDLRVLLFAAALTAMTGIAFGLAPVVRVRGAGDFEGLRDGSRAGGGQKERFRSALVVAEIAASVALLVCAGLLIRALFTVRSIDPGFNPEGVLSVRTQLPLTAYRTVAARDDLYTRVREEVLALPRVTSAGFISYLPISSFRGGVFPVTSGDIAAAALTANNIASLRYVTPGVFQTLGIPLKRGRDVSDADTRTSQFVAVVSESFVKRYWPDADPMGRRFTFASADRVVVGVVGDVLFRGLETANPPPQVYLPARQVDDGAWLFYAPKVLALRTSGSPNELIPAVRDIMRRADPRLPLFELQTLTDMVDLDTAPRAAQVRVLVAFAVVAFGLAAVGIHGLLSFAVSQRVTEIGVRVALGAQSRDILWMVLSRVVVLALAGIVPGVLLAYAAGRSLEALLAGVAPTDTLTLAGAILLAVVMTVAGALAPTARALRVDPITALRSE